MDLGLYQPLYEEIKDLPLEKVVQIMTFARFVKQEYKEELEDELEDEILSSPKAVAYFYDILENGEFVSEEEVWAEIERLPDYEND
ncbi:MAG: hypothetical protein FWG68_05195 [Defluviitaleaceae bacterium]|nr:hypothetical protein [Defluviitaleaceae bacterium]